MVDFETDAKGHVYRVEALKELKEVEFTKIFPVIDFKIKASSVQELCNVLRKVSILPVARWLSD